MSGNAQPSTFIVFDAPTGLVGGTGGFDATTGVIADADGRPTAMLWAPDGVDADTIAPVTSRPLTLPAGLEQRLAAIEARMDSADQALGYSTTLFLAIFRESDVDATADA